MKKIPVGATITRAYRFVFQDFFKILGVIWLPWAIMSASSLLLIPRLISIFDAAGRQDFAEVEHQFWFLVPFLILGLIFYCSQIVSVVDLALQPSRTQLLYHLSLGKPLWRLLGAYLLAVPVFIVAFVAVFLAVAIVGFVLGMLAVLGNAKLVMGLAGAAGALLAYAMMIAVTVRVVWLLAPVTVAEHRLSLGRSWKLSRGNFWRLVLVLLAVLLPFWVVQRAAAFALIPKDVMMSAPPGASAEEKAAVLANVMDWASHVLRMCLDYWYITYPLGLVWTVIYLGTVFGAQAFTYQALIETEASAPIPAD